MVAQGNVGLAFGLVLAATASSLAGALLIFFVRSTNHLYLAAALGFAAGLMLYISLFEMLAREAVAGFQSSGHSENAALRFATLCFFCGCVVAAVLDHAFRFFAPKHRRQAPLLAASKSWARLRILTSRKRRRVLDATASEVGSLDGDAASDGTTLTPAPSLPPPSPPEPADPQLELTHTDIEAQTPPICPAADPPTPFAQPAPPAATPTACPVRKRLGRMAILVAISLAVHNVVEAVGVFVGTLYDPTFGVLVAFSIILHNVPESVCIAFPVYYATGSRAKAVAWTMVPALGKPLGAFVAYLAVSDKPSDLLFGITFGIISGIMVYISVQELLPTAFKYDPENRVVTAAALAGVAVMAVSILLSTL